MYTEQHNVARTLFVRLEQRVHNMFLARRTLSRPQRLVRSTIHQQQLRHGRLVSTSSARYNTWKPSDEDGEADKDPFVRQIPEDDPFLQEYHEKRAGRLGHRPSSFDPRVQAIAPDDIEPKPNTEKDWILPVMSLRDMCTCPRCVDPSSHQKSFSTAEIPPDITISAVTELPYGLQIEWANDLPGFDDSHKSIFTRELFDAMASRGTSKILPQLPRRRRWDDAQFRDETSDLTYEAYMEDDATLYKALQQLHSHGLLFLDKVPESPESIKHIVNRIGPLKNTFYGETWDVRSVPKAKNVAYTSQDLGFHMDLLYLEQPPHLQFLHCIRSSASGGASLFTDSFTAVTELFHSDEKAFTELQRRNITFHYDHIDSNYYQHSRPLIELAPLSFGRNLFARYADLRKYEGRGKTTSWLSKLFKLEDYLEAVSWSPPFQGPFGIENRHSMYAFNNLTEGMEINIRTWRAAAKKFNDIIHRPENIHERLMKPGECVLFDNRRVLHARKAFAVADAGKERWLRGAYLDKDPFISKLRVLTHRYNKEKESS